MTLDFLLGFDTETTGVDTAEDRIVTTSAVLLDANNEILEHFEWLIDPGVEIPEGAAKVHGISTEHAREHGSEPAEAILQIASTLAYYMANGVPVVAYNAAYDFSILNAEIKRHLGYEGFHSFFKDDKIPPMIIDPFVIDKKVDDRPGRRTLGIAAKYYGVSLENAHASYDDCVAACDVLRALWNKYPIFAQGDLTGLYDAQRQWYKEQQESTMASFEKRGKDISDFNTIWPVSTL